MHSFDKNIFLKNIHAQNHPVFKNIIGINIICQKTTKCTIFVDTGEGNFKEFPSFRPL